MPESLSLEPVDDVPAGGEVCDYDELAPAARHSVPSLVAADEERTVRARVDRGFGTCDYVRYTDYYRVSRQPGSGRGC